MTNVRSGISAALVAAVFIAAPVARLEVTLAARQAPRTVTLMVTDPVGEKMTYSIKQIVAKPGEKIKVRLVSMAKIPKVVMAHNFVLLKAGTDPKKFSEAAANARGTDFIPPSMKAAVLASTSMVGPGESMEIVFVAPKAPGKYLFLCSFAGHYAAGMWGELVVK